MKNIYTVAEYALKIGKSRQSVNTWVKQGYFDGYIEMVDGVVHISQEALDRFGHERPVKKDDRQVTVTELLDALVDESTDSKCDSNDTVNGEDQELSNSKEDGKDALIKFLQIQLSERDKQIAEYKAQIADYTNRFADLAKTGHEIADKALRTTEQAHLLQLQAALPNPETTVEEELPKKRGLFGRFKK